MRTSFYPPAVPRALFFVTLLVALVAVAWLVAVPNFLTLSSFAAFAGLLAASALVLKITYSNAQPASSLAQRLHDADSPLHRAPRVR